VRTEARLWGFLAGLFFVFAVVYAFWTWANSRRGIEYVGVVALALSAMFFLLPAVFMALVSRRIDPRPEDRADAEPSDGAGVVGFFSPGSYWPVPIALGALVAAFGISVGQYWMLGVGLLGVLISVTGLLLEYYTGSRRGVEQ
jgi:hypothetical protein